MGKYCNYDFYDKENDVYLYAIEQKYGLNILDDFDINLLPTKYLKDIYYFSFYMHHKNPLTNKEITKEDLKDPYVFWKKTFKYWDSTKILKDGKEKTKKGILFLKDEDNNIITSDEFFKIIKKYQNEKLKEKEGGYWSNKDNDWYDYDYEARLKGLNKKQQFIYLKVEKWLDEQDAEYIPRISNDHKVIDYTFLEAEFEYGPSFSLRDDLENTDFRKKVNDGFKKAYNEAYNKAITQKNKTIKKRV